MISSARGTSTHSSSKQRLCSKGMPFAHSNCRFMASWQTCTLHLQKDLFYIPSFSFSNPTHSPTRLSTARQLNTPASSELCYGRDTTYWTSYHWCPSSEVTGNSSHAIVRPEVLWKAESLTEVLINTSTVEKWKLKWEQSDWIYFKDPPAEAPEAQTEGQDCTSQETKALLTLLSEAAWLESAWSDSLRDGDSQTEGLWII